MQTIHRELQALAEDRFAAYIDNEALGWVVSNVIYERANQLIGEFIIEPTGKFAISLINFTWNNLTEDRAQTSIGAHPFKGSEVCVFFNATATIEIEIFRATDKKIALSRINYNLSNIAISIECIGEKIILTDPIYQLNLTTIERTDKNETDIELARLEGVIAYSIVPKSISEILGKRYEYNLEKIFPAFSFGSKVNLHAINKGRSLGIISDAKMNEANKPCLCNAPDLGLKPAPDFDPSHRDGRSDGVGKGGLSTPTPDNKDPNLDFGNRRRGGSGVVGVYLSQNTASAITRIDRAAQNINISVSDNGHIGFTADVEVSFGEAQTSIDTAGGGLFVDQTISMVARVVINQDLCFARIPIGGGFAVLGPGEPPNMRLGFYPKTDNAGGVTLRGTLVAIDDLDFWLIGVTVYNAVSFGIDWIVKFIGERVMNGILEQKISSAILKKLKEQIAANQWQLINGVPVVVRNDRVQKFSSPFDAAPKSLLISFDYWNADR